MEIQMRKPWANIFLHYFDWYIRTSVTDSFWVWPHTVQTQSQCKHWVCFQNEMEWNEKPNWFSNSNQSWSNNVASCCLPRLFVSVIGYNFFCVPHPLCIRVDPGAIYYCLKYICFEWSFFRIKYFNCGGGNEKEKGKTKNDSCLTIFEVLSIYSTSVYKTKPHLLA